MRAIRWTLPPALWAALLLYGPYPVGAAESEHREHGAHQHGHAVLELVAEGTELAITLRAPAVNAVGFEHAPNTEQQHRQVAEAIDRFRPGERLFVTSAAARCRLASAEVELEGMEEAHAEAHADDKHAPHAASARDDHGHQEEGHAELHADYLFHCEALDRLEAIEVRVFEALLDVEEIEAQVVTETFQGAAELTARNGTLKLGR